MFKLLATIYIALFSVAAAAPSEVLSAGYAPTVVRTVPLLRSALVAEPSHVEVYEPSLAKVGDVVESVPTAISHQSSTVVHSKAARVAPIVAPAVRSYAAPAVRTYAAPLLEQHAVNTVPLVRSVPVELGPAAAFVHANAPLQLRTYAAAAPLYRSYSYGYGTPVVYARDFKK